MPRGDIELVLCERCGCIFNRAFDPDLGRTGADYEGSQAASTHFGAFARGLAYEWVERYDLKNKAVVEVGCGGCEFLDLMLSAGVSAAVGIDPLARSSGMDPRLTVITQAFDASYLETPGDALICRHTLEHIQDVREFLALLKRWADANPGRVLLFEVPDAKRVLAERAFWDVYYEHCNYFTDATLRFAFEVAGFEVVELHRVYGDQYLVLAARSRASRTVMPQKSVVLEAMALCRSFGDDVRASIDRCQSQLSRLARENPPLLLWQGAAKTVGFLSALPNPDVVTGAIDLNPARSGKFLPGSALPVHSPARLPELHPGTIVLMNPSYLDEVRTSVRASGLRTPVYPVNDLLEGKNS